MGWGRRVMGKRRQTREVGEGKREERSLERKMIARE
jgi:hypothetical protein